jgi:ribosomal protein S18 acetylase RimI-like enzyme
MGITFTYKEKTENTGVSCQEWSDELNEYYETDKIQHRFLVTVLLDGKEVGYAVFEYFTYLDEHGDDLIVCDKGMDTAYLESIYVEKDYRGQGIGTELLKTCLKKCDDLCLRACLVMAPDNYRAKAWYEEIGYDISSDPDWYAVDQGFGVYRVRLTDMT